MFKLILIDWGQRWQELPQAELHCRRFLSVKIFKIFQVMQIKGCWVLIELSNRPKHLCTERLYCTANFSTVLVADPGCFILDPRSKHFFIADPGVECKLTGIAGHYRNNPWSAVPDWGRCRNADAGLTLWTNGKTNDAGITFSPVFRHSGISVLHLKKFAEKIEFATNCTVS
jgi:hypothetical protein